MNDLKTENKLEQLEALIEAAERYIEEELDQNRALATLQAARQIIAAD